MKADPKQSIPPASGQVTFRCSSQRTTKRKDVPYCFVVAAHRTSPRFRGGRSADGRQSRTAPGRGSSNANGIVRGALGLGLRGVRSIGAALGRALATGTPRWPAWELAPAVIVLLRAAPGRALATRTPRWPAWELAPVVIVLLRAAPCLASGLWRLLKPSHHNADSGRPFARTRIAQRIEDLFRCVAGLFRSVRDQCRPGAGAFRIRSDQCRSRSG